MCRCLRDVSTVCRHFPRSLENTSTGTPSSSLLPTLGTPRPSTGRSDHDERRHHRKFQFGGGVPFSRGPLSGVPVPIPLRVHHSHQSPETGVPSTTVQHCRTQSRRDSRNLRVTSKTTACQHHSTPILLTLRSLTFSSNFPSLHRCRGTTHRTPSVTDHGYTVLCESVLLG